MAELQRYFVQFDEAIKLKRFKENATLREKRDIIIDKLRKRLKEIFEERDETPPTFEEFDQGSYALGTGVKPTDGDYDIDEGILFDLSKWDYPDPVVVKQWVYEALDDHTDNVKIKNPCVTVQYNLENEPVYHVDLPIYTHDGTESGTIYLARGKPSSPVDQRVWEESDPVGLCNQIEARFEGDDRAQFRRTIRYLKRWRDVNFSSVGSVAPVGIGLTIAAYYWFQPNKQLVDPLQGTYRYSDQKALRLFVQQLINNFVNTYHEGEWSTRLRVTMPVPPYDDPFIRMTNRQMDAFKSKLETLVDKLKEAEKDEVDPVDACKEMQNVFGDDFPVPVPEQTGKIKSSAILSVSTSA